MWSFYHHTHCSIQRINIHLVPVVWDYTALLLNIYHHQFFEKETEQKQSQRGLILYFYQEKCIPGLTSQPYSLNTYVTITQLYSIPVFPLPVPNKLLHMCYIQQSVLSSFPLVPLHLISFNTCFIYSTALQQLEPEPNISKQLTSLLNSFTMNQYQIQTQSFLSSLAFFYFSSDTVPIILLAFLEELCELTFTVSTSCTKTFNFNVTMSLILCQKYPCQ